MIKKQQKKKRLDRQTRKRTLVSCLKCSNCGDIIYSRARHDMHYCRCGETFVDGGFDYLRGGGIPCEGVIHKYIYASKNELYHDWNTQANKYGIIGA